MELEAASALGQFAGAGLAAIGSGLAAVVDVLTVARTA